MQCRTRGRPSESVEQRFRLCIVQVENVQRRERQRYEKRIEGIKTAAGLAETGLGAWRAFGSEP